MLFVLFVNSRHRLYSHMNGCETESQSDMYRPRNHRYVMCISDCINILISHLNRLNMLIKISVSVFCLLPAQRGWYSFQYCLLLISVPSLGVYYCQQLTLSVRMSLCLFVTFLQTASFLFLDGIEPFFGRQFSMWPCTKRCSSIFTRYSIISYNAYMPCQFRPSVCLSVTCVYCIKTAERIIEILSLSDRPIILVFRHQRSLRKSDGFTPLVFCAPTSWVSIAVTRVSSSLNQRLSSQWL